MDKSKMTCADCGIVHCDEKGKDYPEFCLTTHLDEELKQEALALYEQEDTKKVMQTAARVEHDGYLQWTRVQEIIEFAKRMGYKKIGIATCAGLIRETRILTGILRNHGFEVYGVVCKIGAIPKPEVGIDECCCEIGNNTCNPILQAKILNREKTDFNLVVGLCVGHDSMFYKHSDALVSTVVTKDRVLGHNPVAALYTHHSYYKKLDER